jgi:hypothetical protein
MCSFSRPPSPPPAPEPIPETPPVVTQATTTQKAPATARNESGVNRNMASEVSRKRQGRGSLRIPLASLGSGSGLNFPTP